jgi:hypothetical protein
MAHFQNRFRVAAVVLLVPLAACATVASSTPPKQFSQDATLLKVTNDGFADAVIYIVAAGSPLRLGLVNGHSEQTFALPPTMAIDGNSLRLVARPIAGTEYRIDPVNVGRGQMVQLVLRDRTQLSHVAVWNR